MSSQKFKAFHSSVSNLLFSTSNSRKYLFSSLSTITSVTIKSKNVYFCLVLELKNEN